MFFEGRGREHETLRRLVKRLDKAGISYAILGGMAVNAHHYERTTADVDILVTAEGLDEFRNRFVKKNYDIVPDRPRRFLDAVNHVGVDFLVTGRYPGTGAPGPIAFPDPAQVAQLIDAYRVVNLTTLIELKLAARRWRDFADVVELIRFNGLDESFAEKLHPSVRQNYVECIEEKRRDDEYKAIAKIRLAGILLDEKAYDDGLKLLSSEFPAEFASAVADRKGDILVAQNKIEEARAAYQAALDKTDQKNPGRQLIQLKLDAIGGAFAKAAA